MTAHVRGSKRLKTIQNYLNGKEDDDYEVFPTKTENKYIVRKRKEPLAKPAIENNELKTINEEQPKEEPVEEIQIEPPKKESKRIIEPSSYKPSYDPTINIEILNQLKLLGEEIRTSRQKKEQRKIIKDEVQKQMMRPKYNYTQPQYIQDPNEIEQEEQPIEPPPPIIRPQPMRRRNTIFSDIY